MEGKIQSLKDEKKTDQDANMQPPEISDKKRENTAKLSTNVSKN